MPNAVANNGGAGTELQAEIAVRFGVLPNFFTLARESPDIGANLWAFARFAYLDNPLPSLFKERLFVYLSRFCDVRYCVARHVGFLAGLGRSSGDGESPVQSVDEIIRLIRRRLPRGDDLAAHLTRCATLNAPLAQLPALDPAPEEAIFACATHAFLQSSDASKSVEALRHGLTPADFEHLLVLLAFVRTAHYWTKVHSELTLEQDVTQLLAAQQLLADCLLNDPESAACDISQTLIDELTHLRQVAGRTDELEQANAAISEIEARTRQSNTELTARLADLEQANARIRDARRAALNVMEDAVRSQELVEKLNSDLRAEVAERQQAETALREGERRFREMIEALPAAIYTTDAEGRLTHFNQAAVDFSGRVPELGTDQWCVSWKLYRTDGSPMPHDQCPMATALKERRLVRGEEAIAERPDGRRIWFAPYPTPLRDGDGNVVGGINMLIDISERKEAEAALRQSEERFRALVTASAQVVWTTDADGSVVEDSPSWRAFTGQTFAEWKGLGWLEKIHPDDRDRTAEVWREAVARRSPCHTTYRVQTADGGYRWTAVHAIPVLEPNGRVREWVGMNSDITERKQAEDALRDADRHKDEFLATLSHELRNPLAPIRNSVHIMRLAGPDGEVVEQARLTIERQVSQMVRLVDDLLDVSRITRNAIVLRKERVALSSIVQSAVEVSGPLIEAAGHELVVRLSDQTIWLHGDLTRLTQVVANLLNNAAKYTPERGRIALSAERQGNQAVVRVRDSGIGIPPEKLQHIFQMFAQVDTSLERSQGGLGIGLTLAQRLAELHGGTLRAVSEGIGRGSEFTLTLPVAADEFLVRPPDVDDGIQTGAEVRSRRVLVADDNHDSAETLGLVLRMLGQEVRIAHNGAQALEEVAAFRPELALLDIAMPGVSGYDVARQIRAREELKDVVLVALTGWGQEADQQRSRAAGFQLHLTKPADLATLRRLLASLPGSAAPQPVESREPPAHAFMAQKNVENAT